MKNIDMLDRRLALRAIDGCPCRYIGSMLRDDCGVKRLQILWMNKAQMRAVFETIIMN